MTALRPTRYSARNDSTFFQVAGTLVSVRYEATERKKWGLLPQPYQARLEVVVDDGAAVLEHEFELPANLSVGPEIWAVERGLYGVMDEAVRTAMQLRTEEKTERAVREAESEHLYRDEAAGREVGAQAAGGGRRAPDEAVLQELADKLVTAVRHVTKVTSLSPEGLDEYQAEQAETYQRVLQATSPAAALELHDAIRAVEGYLEHEAEEVQDVKRLKERAREYLALLESRSVGGSLVLNHRQRRAVVEEFVPAYAKLQREYREAGQVPTNLVEHAFGSFFGGGITGFLVIDVFGESFIEGLAGMPLDLPGWWIGAGLAFFWPYLKVIGGLLTRESRFERQRDRLVQRMDRRLSDVAGPPLP